MEAARRFPAGLPFIASGPSGFEVLTQGTDWVWGPVDTELVRAYFENNSSVDPPTLDRIAVK